MNACIMQRDIVNIYDVGLLTDKKHYAISIFPRTKEDIKNHTVRFQYAENDGYMMLNLRGGTQSSFFDGGNVLDKLLIFYDKQCFIYFEDYITTLYTSKMPLYVLEKIINLCSPKIYTKQMVYNMVLMKSCDEYFTYCMVQDNGNIICAPSNMDIKKKKIRVIR